MKNINVIALTVALLTGVVASAGDTTSTTTAATTPGIFSRAASAVTGALGSAYAAVKAAPAATWATVKAHPYVSAAAVVAIPAVAYTLWKNKTKIYNAIVENPKTSIAAVFATAAALYVYKAGLPFGSTAATK